MSELDQAASTPATVSLTASVQVLSFEPGLYRVSFSAPAGEEVRAGASAGFPCARIDAPPGLRPGLATIAAQDGWLARPGDAALVQIGYERTPLLLTIYRTSGDAPPAFEVQCLDVRPGVPSAPAAAPYAPPPAGAAPLPAAAAAAAPPAAGAFIGVAHVQGRGDVPVGADGWVGVPGGGMPLEGFALSLTGPDGHTVEYSGELGPDWSTPWARDGEFCGSRGLALPLLGVAGRLLGAGSASFELHRIARFVGGGEVGPMPADAPLAAPGGAPLEAFRFVVSPRPAATVAEAGAGAGDGGRQ